MESADEIIYELNEDLRQDSPDDRNNRLVRAVREKVGDNFFKNGEVKEVTLELDNPLVVNFDKDTDYKDNAITDAVKKAKKNGNDSVILKNMIDAPVLDDKGNGGIVSDVYVVFDKNKIKQELKPEVKPLPVKVSGSRSIEDAPISDDVLNNFETALDAVNWLEANAKEPAFKEIAKKIKGAIDPSVKFVMLGDGQQTLGVLKGRYNYKERNNEIIKNQLEIYDQGKVESTLIHELIHVATSRVINNPKTTKQCGIHNQDRITHSRGVAQAAIDPRDVDDTKRD